MRIVFVFFMIFVTASVKAQTVFPGSFNTISYENAFALNKHMYDSSAQKKWFLSRYAGITAGYNFFRGGNVNFVAAPISMQLNRRLNNNFYAFVTVSAGPAYVNFNHAFVTTDINKMNAGNRFYNARNFAMYSSAAVGLMYINDQKTFSISGSISVERSSTPVYFYNQAITTQPNHIISPY